MIVPSKVLCRFILRIQDALKVVFVVEVYCPD